MQMSNYTPDTKDCRVINEHVARRLSSKAIMTYVLENFVPCRTTFSTASRKSLSVATFLRARIANMPAWFICKSAIHSVVLSW